MLTLYHADHSVCAQKVRVALAEKGLDWQSRFLDLQAGDQHKPEYRNIHPLGLVPVLDHDGRIVLESNVIDEYLDDAFATPPLRPAAARDRARMRLWTKRLDEGLHAAIGVISHGVVFRHIQLRAKPLETILAELERIPDPARRAAQIDTMRNGVETPHFTAAIRAFDRLLADMDSALADDPWLAGAGCSLADIAFIPYVTRLDNLAFGSMVAHRPRLAAWYDRMRARPSYRIAIDDWANAEKLALMRETGTAVWPKVRALLAG